MFVCKRVHSRSLFSFSVLLQGLRKLHFLYYTQRVCVVCQRCAVRTSPVAWPHVSACAAVHAAARTSPHSIPRRACMQVPRGQNARTRTKTCRSTFKEHNSTQQRHATTRRHTAESHHRHSRRAAARAKHRHPAATPQWQRSAPATQTRRPSAVRQQGSKRRRKRLAKIKNALPADCAQKTGRGIANAPRPRFRATFS
jgi:hypothetical protein